MMKKIGDGISDQFLTEAYHAGEGLKFMCDTLSRLGYVSATGLTLSNSHVSNHLRKKLGLRMVKDYNKPGYKGYNWTYFA